MSHHEHLKVVEGKNAVTATVEIPWILYKVLLGISSRQMVCENCILIEAINHGLDFMLKIENYEF